MVVAQQLGTSNATVWALPVTKTDIIGGEQDKSGEVWKSRCFQAARQVL